MYFSYIPYFHSISYISSPVFPFHCFILLYRFQFSYLHFLPHFSYYTAHFTLSYQCFTSKYFFSCIIYFSYILCFHSISHLSLTVSRFHCIYLFPHSQQCFTRFCFSILFLCWPFYTYFYSLLSDFLPFQQFSFLISCFIYSALVHASPLPFSSSSVSNFFLCYCF